MKKIKFKGKINLSLIDKIASNLDRIVLLPTECNYVFVSQDPIQLDDLHQNEYSSEQQKIDIARFIKKSEINLDYLNEPARKIVEHFFPGPLIAILPEGIVGETSQSRYGIQLSNSQLVNNILEQLKSPLYFFETENQNPISNIQHPVIKNKISLYLETDITNPVKSTIIDLTQPSPVILKKGAIPILEIEKVIGSRVKLGSEVYFSVLFICSGNSCRSPIAKGIFDKMLEKKNVFIYSAGTIATSGNLPSEFAVIAAQKYGADINHHLSAPLTKELINDADLILVMSPKHKDHVIELVLQAQSKTFLLREYAFGIKEEVEDPIGAPLEVFEKVAAVINESLEKVALDIKERLNN